MLQTWGKFCFQEGIAEIRAKMPGKASQMGLWPAFWLMGNLGRATFEHSTDGFWPYIFDECVPLDHDDCDANQCSSQKVSACDAEPGFGFNAYQGRGAPEIDVIEVQPGGFTMIYGANKAACARPPDAASKARLEMPQPFVSTSLQAAPGMPRGSHQRPSEGCRPYDYTAPDGTVHPEWFFPELDIFNYGTAAHETPFHVGANYEFWGDWYPGYMSKHPKTGVKEGLHPLCDPEISGEHLAGCRGSMQTDAYSANTALSDVYWEGQHIWRVEWRSGKDGYIRWSLDGAVQFQLEASMLHKPKNVTFMDGSGRKDGVRRPLHMPQEPSSTRNS